MSEAGDSFGARFLAHLHAEPQRPFAEHGPRRVTRAEAAAAARHLAAHFAADGIGPGDRVALACLDSLRAIEATLALWSLGAAPAFLDLRQSAEDITAAAARLQARAVFSDAGRFRRAAGIRMLPAVPAGAEGLAPLTMPARAGALPAVWLSSSGTTRLPVHQPRLHADFLAKLADAGRKLGVHPLPDCLAVGSLAFGAVATLWLRAIADGAHVLSLPVFHRLEELDAALARTDVAYAGIAPVELRDLLARHRHRTAEAPAYPNLRCLVSRGGPIAPADLRAVRERLSPQVCNVYSLTHVGPVSVLSGAAIDSHPGSVGRPLPGVLVSICDAEDRPLPPGQPGRIIATNVSGQGQPVVTGDHGWIDAEGFLFLGGRADMIACRKSVTISLTELENRVLARADVRDCCAFALPDDTDGGDFIALAVEGRIDRAALIAWLRATIPAATRPDYLFLAESLPRNAAGKIARAALRAAAMAPHPNPEDAFVRF